MAETVEITLRLKLRYPVSEIGKRELRSHIVDAVETWGGQRHPDDLLFDGIQKATTSGVRVLW
jgi:hypothetical protein